MKYGLVPQTVYPESFNSSNSGQVDALVAAKLREDALVLRKTYNKAVKRGASHEEAVAKARTIKEDQMADIYRVLAICAGTPPHPNESFVWEFRDKNNECQRIVTTPLDFARKEVCGYDVCEAIALLHDPRNEPHQLYTVQRLGNVVGGVRQVRYASAEISELKQAAISALRANTPVWFGCDVEQAASSAHGILDVDIFNYHDAFGTSVNMSKTQRLETGDLSMTHAMMLTGVHIVDGKVIRWRVENSWGPEACSKGFWCMSDSWFDANVFQVVVPRTFAPVDLVRLYDNSAAPVNELPPWDPMGALAGKMGSSQSQAMAGMLSQLAAMGFGGGATLSAGGSSSGGTATGSSATSSAASASTAARSGMSGAAATTGRSSGGASARSSRY
ncbi:hypothetical protein RQP46_004811 [Phenoliferia psychrophenolica]